MRAILAEKSQGNLRAEFQVLGAIDDAHTAAGCDDNPVVQDALAECFGNPKSYGNTSFMMSQYLEGMGSVLI